MLYSQMLKCILVLDAIGDWIESHKYQEEQSIPVQDPHLAVLSPLQNINQSASLRAQTAKAALNPF